MINPVRYSRASIVRTRIPIVHMHKLASFKWPQMVLRSCSHMRTSQPSAAQSLSHCESRSHTEHVCEFQRVSGVLRTMSQKLRQSIVSDMCELAVVSSAPVGRSDQSHMDVFSLWCMNNQTERSRRGSGICRMTSEALLGPDQPILFAKLLERGISHIF